MSRSTQSTSATGSTDEGLGFNKITIPPSDEASSLFEQQQRQLLASMNEIQCNLLKLNKPYLDCMADATINGRKCKGKNDTRQGKKQKRVQLTLGMLMSYRIFFAILYGQLTRFYPRNGHIG